MLLQLTQEITETESVLTKTYTAITHEFDGKLEGIKERELLHHQLESLMRNTAEAGADLIDCTAKKANAQTGVGVPDNLRLPERALENLF